jgi:6-phosphofructokinase 1
MLKRIIVGESGGPTPVIDWEVCGIMDAAQRAGLEIYGMMNGLEGLLNANIEGNIIDLSNLDPMSFAFNGPGAGLRTTRLKPTLEQYKKMASNLGALKVDGIIYIGGNDSADQLLGLIGECGLAGIHAIKTVDNDLPVTHHCPGYGSAALYNAVALKNVHNDFSSYQVWGNFEKDGRIVEALSVAPVVIYQVMGRKAGWLAHSTAFAKVDPRGTLMPDRPPHIVLSKEMLFDKREFLDRLDRVITRRGEAVVAVQEDLTDKETGEDMAKIYSDGVVTDDHGNIQHGRADSFSTSLFLAQLIHRDLKVESVLGKIKEAALVPQHIQRSNVMSPVDASEAYMVGYAAVEAMMQGATGQSVVLKRPDGKTVTELTDLANIAAKDRSLPLDYINGLDGPTQEFIDEFIYLIGGPMGIPHYSYRKFKFKTVPIPAEIKEHPYIKGKDEYKWPLKEQSVIQ